MQSAQTSHAPQARPVALRFGRSHPGLALLLVLPGFCRAELMDVVTEEVTRFSRLLQSAVAERRIEGVQGLSHLKHWPAEEALLGLLADPAPPVQRQTVQALGRLGTAKSVPHLVRLLDQPSWELRQNAWLALCRMTALDWPVEQPGRWRQWWASGAATHHEAALLAIATHRAATARSGPAPDSASGQQKLPAAGGMPAWACSRRDALRALRHFATPANEPALLTLLGQPGLSRQERAFVAEALERAGTSRAVPALAAFPSEAAAWALGRLGGPEAERALLSFPKTLGVLLNLDRLHSTNAGPWLPQLVAQMGLVTYRGQPDDLMNPAPQPIQRVAANLILRSGRAPELVHQVLLELEYSSARPPAGPRPAPPPEWRAMLEAMRSELKPGFVREDGVTTSQPLTTLPFLARDRALTPRLLPLLRHPAFVPRIYVALTLARLGAPEAVPALLEIIREGYPFSDAVALASGKHFDQSQTVRWRGFLCLALGRLGSQEARAALEALAADATQPRDIRYCAVVGLGFIGSTRSLPTLRRVAAEDIIWMVREEARRVATDIELGRS